MSSQMVDVLTRALEPRRDSPYDQLPMAVKQYYSPSEYACLTDSQKIDLLRSETEPDPE